tara:strand:+ start:1367 stop:2308 length:942 start_codon:yes stop_codon:yes gene_type:complete
LKQLRKDYFLDAYAFVNSNTDFHSLSIIDSDKTDIACSLCKINTNSDEFIVKSTDTPIELEKFNNSSINNFSLEQDKMRHYYIADSSHKNLSKLSVNKLHKLLLEVQKVNKEMISDNLKNIQIFANSGSLSDGNSIHNGFELINLPIISPTLKNEIDLSKQSIFDLGICPICRIINFETGGPRQILSTVSFLAFCPWSSSHPFEFWIYPKSHQYSFTLIDNNELEDLAQILRSTLGGLDNVLNNPSYNIIFHNSLNEIDSEIHWHIEIIPQLSYSTGFKSGFGISVNSLIPEKSAEILGKASRKELASLVGVI